MIYTLEVPTETRESLGGKNVNNNNDPADDSSSLGPGGNFDILKTSDESATDFDLNRGVRNKMHLSEHGSESVQLIIPAHSIQTLVYPIPPANIKDIDVDDALAS